MPQMTITQSQLIELLRIAGLDIPNQSQFSVQVPGGGDWSNTDLSLEDAPLKVEWVEDCEVDNKTILSQMTINHILEQES